MQDLLRHQWLWTAIVADATAQVLKAIFALIGMYDAGGVRRATGQQAVVRNEPIEELGEVLGEGFNPEALRIVLGHSYTQVFAGLLLGIAVALVSFGVWPA